MKLAIVGSHKIGDSQMNQAQKIIEAFLIAWRPSSVVSGGATGVDTIAAQTARDRGIPVKEFLPEKPKWYYYKKRNKLIAEACDVLLAIRWEKSRTKGSAWTADYAEKLGKRVYRFEVQ